MTENEQKVSDSVKLKVNKQLALIEAALYVAGRPLDLKTLAKIAGTRSKKRGIKLAKTLVENYRNRQTVRR